MAFAITINRSQGQTFEKLEIYSSTAVFSHGQLYVAFSRATSQKNIYIKIVDNTEQGHLTGSDTRLFTKNVVYKEIFDK